MSRPRVAVVGTGIAGMAAAYFLRHTCDVVFYEKEPRPGGHTHTVQVLEEGKPIFVDTGFMVFNERTYPNLIRFFKELDVPSADTSMSFSVQHGPTGLEYCGSGLSGLFAQRRNVLRPRYWKLLSQIHAFNQHSPEVLEGGDPSETVSAYVHRKGWGRGLLEKYLIPMSAAIWSTPADRMMDFPVTTLVRFFKNHGLLGITTHFQWKTIPGGSRVYRDKLLSLFPGALRLGSAVRAVRVDGPKVRVADASGSEQEYDKVVLACHADEALSILATPTPEQVRLLRLFRYHSNRVLLHTDESVMPRARRAWSSWNYRIEVDGTPSVIYWMNSLQSVSRQKNYFVSVNDPGQVSAQHVLWDGVYEHPVFDAAAVAAQKRLAELHVSGPVFFCGSYFRYGFHEDAFTAGMEAAGRILGRNPWP